MPPRRSPRIRSFASLVALLLLVAVARQLDLLPAAVGDGGRADRPTASSGPTPSVEASSGPAAFEVAPRSDSASTGLDASDARAESGAERVARAFSERESGVRVTLDAIVDRVLPDDRDGSRHQRFLVRLPVGPRLLVAHNVDLAERVPVEPGQRVRLRGQYEWNERGGVLHWTHADPDGRHPGGWIEVDGRRIE